MKRKTKTSLLIPKFIRYGGEGLFTKIITSSNNFQYVDLLQYLDNDETPLIVYKYNLDWTLLTDKRILTMFNGCINIILNENLQSADTALKDEFANGVKNQPDFTKISLKDINNTKFIITVEKGLPYNGLLQVLHFIATR
jgi:hypothetical protein